MAIVFRAARSKYDWGFGVPKGNLCAMEPVTHRMDGRGRRLLLGAAVVAAGLGVAVVFVGSGGTAVERDLDLCPAEPAHPAVLLVDLQKPLQPARFATLLRDVSVDLAAETELRVYALTSDANPPRQLLGRICKPYDNADLEVDTAKDAPPGQRDCDRLPAQLPPDVRQTATRFCALRRGLQRRIERLAAFREGAAVVNAHLIEAADASVYELAGQAGERRLYVFSDMLQHAGWYSHLDLEWSAWQFERFASLRRARGPKPGPESLAGLRVRVLYVPRVGLTDLRRPRVAHQNFWRAYFGAAEVEFHAREPSPAYTALPAMPAMADRLSIAREERTALESQRRDLERQLARIAREAGEIEAERLAQARLTEGHEAAREELRQQEATLRRELERLREAAARRPAPATAELPVADPAPVLAADAADEEPAAAAEAAAQLPDESRGRVGRGARPTRTVTAANCRMELHPRFAEQLPIERYAGDRRVNYGTGTIVVRFAIDAGGATVDDEVAPVAGRSTAEEAEHFDALAGDAVGTVRDWVFAVEAPDGRNCGRQEGAATFVYGQRCMGVPVPSCRTVRTRVSLLDATAERGVLFRGRGAR